ncbi:hypothetical protein RAS1_40480 [Phycisphaerae bacterium RAS1]|nr:hypothetical protein RAS1_40480 [Phycisphaerae bacterium RAS1]
MRFLRNTISVALLISLHPGCTQRAADAGGSHRADADGYRQITSNGGAYRVRYRPRPQPIPMNAPFALDVEIEPISKDAGRAGGAERSDVMLNVDADMPEHGHGMNTKPIITRTGPGRFTVGGLLFHMPGYWEVYLDITRDNRTERAQFDVTLE